jgi:hypothetical protein
MMRSGFFGSGILGSGFIVALALGAGAGEESEPTSGQGDLFGYSENGGSPAAPPEVSVEFFSGAVDDVRFSAIGFEITVADGSGSVVLKLWLSDSDPLSDYTWVDTGAASDPSHLAGLLAGAINAAAVSNVTANNGGSLTTIGFSSSGSSASLACIPMNSTSNISVNGGGNGADGTEPSGQVTEVVVIPAPAGGALTVEEVTYQANAQGFDLPDDAGWEVGWYDGLGDWKQVASGGDVAPFGSGELSPLFNVDVGFETSLLSRYLGTPPSMSGGQQGLTVSASGRWS